MSSRGRRVDRRQFIKDQAGLGAALTLPLLRAGGAAAQARPAEITSMTAAQLSGAIRARDVSCAEVMQAYLERIRRYNPVYNAVVSLVDEDVLIEQARAADDALARGEYWGWMHGMPHAVKDIANAQGLPTSFGSRIHAGTVASADDIHIARIRAAGAIFIGKTNVPEFGLGSQSYNDVHGTTRNAYDPGLTAGGSSGGAAVGMATQMLPTADGSDMMGSLRNPAAFNNVIGFRPSQGRVPGTSTDPFYSQLSTNGPMGRNVEDTVRLLATLAGFDVRAPLTMQDRLPDYDRYRVRGLSGLRIAWLGDYDGYLSMEPGVLGLCAQALAVLERSGAIVETALPAFDMDRLWRSWLTLRHWSQTPRQALLENPATRDLLKPEMVWEIEGSYGLTGAELSEAAIARAAWYEALNGLFERFDLLALPSAQVFPFPAQVHWPQAIAGRTMDTYHRWMEVVIGASLAGVPAVSLPVGFDDRGRPMGLQFLGPLGQDRVVLEFAMAYEAVTNFLGRRPSLTERL
ncbi:MAG TPA: amidase [Gammaproteobacteria bacterium]|nr:amidase [Gammaproteobacteria bacterium]